MGDREVALQSAAMDLLFEVEGRMARSWLPSTLNYRDSKNQDICWCFLALRAIRSLAAS
jgi:hypothetical protein